MSLAFDTCRKKGGRMSTKALSGGRYMHICILGGKTYAGDVKMKKKPVRYLKS